MTTVPRNIEPCHNGKIQVTLIFYMDIVVLNIEVTFNQIIKKCSLET